MRRLGDIDVSMASGTTYFDFGEWKSEVATKKNPDGTISFVTIVPGMSGFEFVVGAGAKKTLITRDAQHEYIFEGSSRDRSNSSHVARLQPKNRMRWFL